ncbi:MAG: aminotransferase class I/II-fold pyridoxal phosphate-dependent enzyme [Actinobacteria bacterium]|nr:aminotransferase class I/II-fold pyridoxal phosphate-dependent enzyme [Actinomycetota bacterium]
MQKLPDFPWDLLAPYGEKAKKYPAGFIDLSQGTPVDPTPEFIQTALAKASNSPSYPLTAGSEKLKDAIKVWSVQNLGVTGEFDVLPTIGSKELIALLPTLLQSKSVLYPNVAYPTYLVGALMASAQATPVDIDATSWPKADLAWLNSPANPTGQVQSKDELQAAILIEREKWLDQFTERRREIANIYISEFNNPKIRLLSQPPERSAHVYHLFVSLCDERDRLSEYLKKKHIQSLIHYPVPIHIQESCKDIKRDLAGLKNSEEYAKTCLSLPCHPQMSDKDISRVVDAINEFK